MNRVRAGVELILARNDADRFVRRDVLNGVIASDPRVLADPAPAVLVAKLADSGIDITVRVWVERTDYWATLFDMQEKIKTTFDREGIEIPFPQRDIHIRSDVRVER